MERAVDITELFATAPVWIDGAVFRGEDAPGRALAQVTNLQIFRGGGGEAAAVMAPSLFGACGVPWDCVAS